MRVGVMKEAAKLEVVEMEHSMVDWDRCWLQPPGSAEEFALDWARNHMNRLQQHWEVRLTEEAVEPPDLVVMREDVPFRLAVVVGLMVDSLRVPVGMAAVEVVEDTEAALRLLLVDSLVVQVAVFGAVRLGHNLDRKLEHHSHIPLEDLEGRWHFVEDTVLEELVLLLGVRTFEGAVVIVG